jgi:K+-sensing histidine kinase KdpD
MIAFTMAGFLSLYALQRLQNILPLSISRRLVEAMGGAIMAQSPAVRRRGTRIVVRLPADRATPVEPRPAA